MRFLCLLIVVISLLRIFILRNQIYIYIYLFNFKVNQFTLLKPNTTLPHTTHLHLQIHSGPPRTYSHTLFNMRLFKLTNVTSPGS